MSARRPAYWGHDGGAVQQKADLWPLNPDGELVNWTIVESKEGLAHVREIAAGQGHRRAVARRRHAARRVLDDQRRRASACSTPAAWENAIQQVLAACKEFHVPCGFPATASDIELRMKQGFSVLRDELGRRRLQGGRSRPRPRRDAEPPRSRDGPRPTFVLNDRPNCDPPRLSCMSNTCSRFK